jgi:hypothetical protein
VIDAIAPIFEFIIQAFLGAMLFVPAWLLRKLLKIENWWIRPALWLAASVVWPLLTLVSATAEMRHLIFPDVVADLFTQSLLASAIFFVPWTLLALVRSRKAAEGRTIDG